MMSRFRIARLRQRLLATASAAVLLWSVGHTDKASAAERQPAESGRWSVAFDGSLNQAASGRTEWWPGGGSSVPEFISPGGGADAGATITYRPQANDLRLALGVRYGKSVSQGTFTYPANSKYSGAVKDTESHTIVDFDIGRDVGLGKLGARGATSVASAGVRFADFSVNEAFSGMRTGYYSAPFFGGDSRRFVGAGPRAAWDISVPLAQGAPMAIDTELSGALLFGEKTASGGFGSTFAPSPPFSRNNLAAVPNVAISAALSWHIQKSRATLSLGYRTDAYFGVIDGGGPGGANDVDRVISGPFARFAMEFE